MNSSSTRRPSGFAIATWCYTQGAYVAQYLSFGRMLINIFCFNIVWVFIQCLPVIFATRYGIDLWIWLRSVLGKRGVAVLSTVISIANFGWYAVAACPRSAIRCWCSLPWCMSAL